MKTPWSNLIQYGVGFATVIVLAIAGILMLSVVAVAILLSKFLMIIK